MTDVEVTSSLDGYANYSGIRDTVIGEDASMREIAEAYRGLSQHGAPHEHLDFRTPMGASTCKAP